MKRPNEDSPNGSVFVKSYKDLKGTMFNIALLPTGGMKMPKAQANAMAGGLAKAPGPLIIPFWFAQESAPKLNANVKVVIMKSDAMPSASAQVLTNESDVAKGGALIAPLASLMPKRKAEEAPAPAVKKSRK
eukprot:7603591-Pyramimonas_sp.AAC.1